MSTKHLVMLLSFGVMGIAIADLVWGNTDKPVLPEFLDNLLNQQEDVALLGVGAIGLYFSFNHLKA